MHYVLIFKSLSVYVGSTLTLFVTTTLSLSYLVYYVSNVLTSDQLFHLSYIYLGMFGAIGLEFMASISPFPKSFHSCFILQFMFCLMIFIYYMYTYRYIYIVYARMCG